MVSGFMFKSLIHFMLIFIKQQDQVINLHYEVKEECEKADLKLNIQKTKIMAYSPITS